MAVIFDGRKFAQDKENLIRKKVTKLLKKGIVPKLASILVGDDPASKLYLSLKKKAAERVEIDFEVVSLSQSTSLGKINETIEQLNKDEKVHGVMIQLPLPSNLKYYTSRILNSISKEKDVDGLRKDSPFIPATVKAVLSIIDEAKKILNLNLDLDYCVVGARGTVGKKLVKELKRYGLRVMGLDKEIKDLPAQAGLKLKTKKADVLISATGVPKLITADMVNNGAIVIDVGSPRGDVDFESVYQKAKFITPVPGGVGPVTITCLLENLVDSLI